MMIDWKERVIGVFQGEIQPKTSRDKVALELANSGFRIAANQSSHRFVTFTHPDLEAKGIKIYLGRNGALRMGKIVSTSTSMTYKISAFLKFFNERVIKEFPSCK
jgi:hypothetical protein